MATPNDTFAAAITLLQQAQTKNTAGDVAGAYFASAQAIDLVAAGRAAMAPNVTAKQLDDAIVKAKVPATTDQLAAIVSAPGVTS